MPRISGAHRGEGVQVVVFALQILEYLAQHRSTVGVTDLARVFDTTKSRMHRHLQTLVAAGYAPVMPTFAGQLSEDDLAKLVAYIQSIGALQQGKAADARAGQ